MKKLVLIAIAMQAAESQQLRITVYDSARLPREVMEGAFDDLKSIFQYARIDIQVVRGDLTAPEASLLELPSPAPKGAERVAACRARRDIVLEVVGPAPSGYRPTILGYAQPLASAGLNVRVFDDRIRWTAEERHRPHATVLAHVMAHEIGHVLLRAAKHSSGGLMSAVWIDADYAWMSRSLMFFNRQQANSMRMELSAANCSRAVSTQSNH